MILYQGTGESIRDSLIKMTYNNIRSHHYILFHLSRLLGCTNVLDGSPSYTGKIAEGSELYYTLREFKEYNFDSVKLGDYSESLAVLFHTTINKSNYNKILSIISSSKYFIYYNSDPEFNKDYLGGEMFLNFIRNNPNDRLSLLFKSRCILIFTGFPFMVNQLSVFDKPVIYIPQIINPNIPRINSRKIYDVWMINTSPFHKHLSDALIDNGISVLALTQNGEYCEGIPYIECKGSGLNLDFLIASVSLCKYYIGSYPVLEDQDSMMIRKYSTWNHTSKVLESYYANTYWLSSNKNFNQCVYAIKNNLHKNQKNFNEYVESNFSLSKYKSQLLAAVDICRKSIK